MSPARHGPDSSLGWLGMAPYIPLPSAPVTPTLLSWLQLQPGFHRAIRALKLVELASAALKFRPLRRQLPGGTQYRVRYAESLLMADEIFNREVYRDPFEGQTIRTFV